MANLSSTRIFGDGTVERSLYVKQRLGVGVGNPDYAVDVFGDIRLNAEGSGNGKAQVRFNEGSGTNAYIGYDGENLNGGDNRLEFNSNGTHMVIENRGRVGIGTTSPRELLEVYGNNTTLRLQENSGTAYRFEAEVNYDFDNPVNLRGKNGDVFLSQEQGDNEVHIHTSSTKRLSVVDGNVGIGTTSPQTKLDVEGLVTSGDREAGASPGWIGYNNTKGFFAGSGSDNAFFGLRNRNGSGGGSNLYNTVIYWGDDVSDDLEFVTQDNGEVGRFTGDGNFGIGTNSPSNDLDINTSGTDSGISFGGSEALTGTTGNGWLRLNQNNNFSNGVYTPGPIRADGNGSGRAAEFQDDVDMTGNDINNVGNINVKETIGLPSGNTAERPNNPVLGMMRYNTEVKVIEVYNGEEWVVIADVSGEDSLYEFTSATFTPGGSTGRLGPSLTEAKSGLSGPEALNWKNNISFFNVSGGIQEWTVPADSNYRIRVEGAAGQNTNNVFGSGAILEAEFELSAGSKLRILCGQRSVYAGTRDWQGGSGGTFVTTESNEPLIIAGGGGTTRSSTTNFSELDANTGTSGKDGSGTLGGTNGGAGQPGGHNQDASGGAAGFNEDGQSHTDRRNVRPGDPDPFPPARAFVNGGEGGFFATAYEDGNNPLHGGFGGGGSGGWGGAGGGGGYSGGGDCDNSDYSGGGGSFISSSASNAGTSDGSFSTTGSEPTSPYVGGVSNIGSFNDNNQGSVTITKLV